MITQSTDSLILLSTNSSQNDITSQASSITNDENERFSKHGPFLNLLIMSVGPILTTIGMSVLDSIDLMIISYRFKNDPNSFAVQIIGIGFFIQKICMYIGMYFQQSIMVRASSLIGEMKRDEACQLIVDIFRIAILFNIITTIVITFISRPLMNFAGCTPDLIEQCMLLVISTIAGLPFITLFHIGTGFLQAIGKPFLNGLLHLVAYFLQTLMITPFLQFVIRINVTLSNISQPIAQSIVVLILFVLIFSGKYSLKPSLRMFFNNFSKETPKSLIMALPMIPTALFAFLPATLILGFMTSASMTDDLKNDIIAVFTILQKLFMIGVSLPKALAIGFLTAATHSMAQKNIKRMLVSLCYSLLIFICFFIIFIPLVVINPVVIMKIFGISIDSQLEIAKKMIPIPFYTFVVGSICIFLVNFFIAVGKPLYSNVTSFTQVISICVGSKILNLKYPNAPLNQMYSYVISDLSTFLLTVICFVVTLIPLIKKSRK